MPDYSLAKIYQIICNTTGKRYIGATVQKKLCTRLAQHVSKRNDCSSKEIIDNGNYEMVLIEDYPCTSKDQLHQRERFYIESMECVNKQIPCRTETENKEYQKEWYAHNKEQIQKYKKEWYADNKEQIQKYKKEYDKKYHQQNRDILNKKRRERYHATKQTPEEHREERREYWQSKKEIKKVPLSPTE